jgi:hypothetical protein
MSGAEPRASCRGLFRKLEILPVPCQYILSLMLFIIDIPNNFQTGLEIHGLHIRSKKSPFRSNCKPHKCSKRNYLFWYQNIHNSLPSNILKLKNDRKQFKNELCR